MAVHLVVARELGVEVARENFNVTGFVHDLRCGVVLGIDPRHRLDNLRRTQERTLFTVHELAQHPVLVLHVEIDPLFFTPRREGGSIKRGRGQWTATAVHVGLVCERLLVDRCRPIEVGRSVPLRALGLLVELVESGAKTFLVVPREHCRAGVDNFVMTLFINSTNQIEDGLHVIDLIATDDRHVRCHDLRGAIERCV